MNKVFEDFLTVAFREAMRAHGGRVSDQVTTHSLDEGGELDLRPDLAWGRNGRWEAVLDAKYKAIEDGVMRHADAYQMLAYCIAYSLPRGFLVYAKDSGAESRIHTVRHSGHRIIVSAIDVGKEPEDLLQEVRALAAVVAQPDVE